MINELKYTPVDYNPFTGAKISKIAPTSESQKEIYVSSLLGGQEASLAFNESVSLALNGAINAAILQQALNILVSRHEGLRAAISTNGENLIIYQNQELLLNQVDLKAKTEEEQQTFIQSFLHQQVNEPFNLNATPLFKTCLISTSETAHLLVITGHHIILDGWSIGVVLQELSKIYSSLLQQKEPPLAPAKQISDYAKEEAVFEQSKEFEKIKSYWLNKLKNKSLHFDFPTDFPRPEHRNYNSKRIDFTIDENLVKEIKKVGAKAGATFVTTLIAGFEILLSKIAETNQVIFGLPTAGQSATGSYDLISHCVNLLAIKSHINPEVDFVEYLKSRKAEIAQDYEHQRITIATIAKNLSFQRDAAKASLLSIAFNVDLGYDDHVNFGGVPHVLISNPRSYETFDIFLNIGGSESNLKTEWSFNTNLFKDDTILKYHQQFIDLLNAFVQNPNQAIKNIILNQKNKVYTLDKSLNNTNVPFPKDKSLDYFLRQTAEKFPQKIAVSAADGKLSYQALDQKSNQFAHWLSLNGIKTGDKVGLLLARDTNMMVAIIGVLKSGATYIPFDAAYPAERIAYMLADAEATCLLAAKTFENKFNNHSGKTYVIENIMSDLASCDAKFSKEINAEEVLYILYTSGSTGKPKGAQIRHCNAVNLLLAAQKEFDFSPDDKALAISTISFDISVPDIYLPLISGAEVAFASNDDIIDPQRLVALMEKDVTFMQATPSAWQMLIDAGWKSKNENLKIVAGGEALTKDLAHKILARSKSLWNIYGPTETTVFSICKKISADDEIISLGRPIHNTQIYFLDENLNQVNTGDLGEIFIGGAGVSKGYINNPSLNQERFLSINLDGNTETTLYRTGDLGKVLADGNIQYYGRIDNQVKIRGYRIELGEIEENLATQANIKNAVVKAVEIQEGNKQLIAYVVPQNYQADENYQEDIKGWKAALSKVLPGFMIPAHFYLMEQLPYSPNGKIARNELPIFWNNHQEKATESGQLDEQMLNDMGISTSNALNASALNKLNNTQVCYPREKTLDKFLTETAQAYPNNIAVSTLQKQLNYRQLDEQSSQFANYLKSKGIKSGATVGLAFDRSVEMVVALIGIIKCGATYLPIDPAFPAERIAYMLKDAGAEVLITEENYAAAYQINAQILLKETIFEVLPTLSTAFSEDFSADQLLYILHTSGSTGKPKGVKISHYNLVNVLLCLKDRLAITPEDKWLAVSTISFDIAEVEIFLPLITGAEVKIADKDEIRNAEKLVWYINTQNITFMQATPYSWQMVLDAGWNTQNNLKVLCCGEQLAKDLAHNLLNLAGEVWNLYGPTETTVFSTLHKLSLDDQQITIGTPVSNTQIYFLDEHLQQVEAGEIGEMFIAGDGVSKGYINKDELTQERFIPNVIDPHGGEILYKTGDLGRLLPNGTIQCLGRIDYQVKIRGYRIEVEEIEQQLLKSTQIDKVLVVAATSPEGSKQLVAYVIPHQYQANYHYQTEINEWKAALSKVVPHYMVPSFFCLIESFPKSPNGKLDRNALPNPFEQAMLANSDTFKEASTPDEIMILEIWKKALKRDQISVSANFFDLGGHSLLAVQVMQSIEKATKIKLPLASLFTYPTIEGLAKLLTNQTYSAHWDSLIKIKPGGKKTPLYLIHGSGLNALAFYPIAKHLDADQPVYGLQAKGLDGSEVNFKNVTEIAEAYNKEILADNPNGPYAFIGYSLGGILAVEMARLLEEMGKKVTFIGAVDTYISTNKKNESLASRAVKKVVRQQKKLVFFSKQFVNNPLETVNYQLSWAKNTVGDLINSAKVIPPKTIEDKINQVYMDAFEDYEMKPYNGKIWLFKATKRLYFLDDPIYLGWKPFALKGVNIKDIPGDHATFYQAPNDKLSAKIFQDALDEVQ